MRVFIDCRMLYSTGIGRYIRNLLKASSDTGEKVEYLLAGDPRELNSYLVDNENLLQHTVMVQGYTVPICGVTEQVIGKYWLHKYRDVDIIHFPHYNVPWLLPANSVVTIHDIIPFIFPEYFNKLKVFGAKKVMGNAVKKAGKVIAISESTARDLINMFPNAGLEDKICIIYQGTSDRFYPLPAEDVEEFKQANKLRKYILYVGNRTPHKNLKRLIEAYARLQSEFPDLKLVLAGPPLEKNIDIVALKEKLGLGNLIEWDNIPDKQLHLLYCGAEALVFPSLYEGFGLPPLEAMACGTPVVVSNSSSLPEVVGDAGIYFDPYNIEDMVQGIYQVISDSDLRQVLRKKGLERAMLFTWEKTARQTLEVYKELMSEQRSNKR